MPSTHRQAQLHKALEWTGIGALAVFGWLPLGGEGLGAVVSAATILALTRALASLRCAQRSLLIMTTCSRADTRAAASQLEQLAERSRDPKVKACIVASLAELELYEGDVRRGQRLFRSLRARGWSPRTLFSGWTRAYASVLDAAATFAAVEAVSGDVQDASRTLDGLQHAAGLASTRLLRAIVLLRQGELARSQETLQLSDGPRLELPGRSRAIAALRASVVVGMAELPYRSPRPPVARAHEHGRLRWLIASPPAFRAFVEGDTT